MALTDHIDFLLRAEQHALIEDAHRRSRRRPVDPADEPRHHGIDDFAFAGVLPSVIAIEQYLNALDLTTLLRLEQFIYLGRDGADMTRITDCPDELGRTKVEVVRSITVKVGDFCEFFTEALVHLSEEGIELEAVGTGRPMVATPPRTLDPFTGVTPRGPASRHQFGIEHEFRDAGERRSRDGAAIIKSSGVNSGNWAFHDLHGTHGHGG